MKKAYYAHCLAIYNTPQEERDLETIRELGYDPVNPNCVECSEGYKREGMDYFKLFTDTCDIIIFRANPDGSIPAGIGKEIEFFDQVCKTVIELPSSIQRRLLTVDQTREYLREVGHR